MRIDANRCKQGRGCSLCLLMTSCAVMRQLPLSSVLAVLPDLSGDLPVNPRAIQGLPANSRTSEHSKHKDQGQMHCEAVCSCSLMVMDANRYPGQQRFGTQGRVKAC
eukprot:1160381-Pelagomonas_calceolata.AAC.9